MISDDLRKIISERGIRQKDICKALGLSQSYTSELLSGKKEFSLDLLERLCDFLQVDIKLVDKHRQ
ncbi:MAG: helix-turn-helix transcriptional regulator [Treponema sp.]|nr:helix-turn-helix transcriptional regulator [Treponema sp.]MBD5439422.1 helix-turn-helix transcriptional regulator [Treponema sp.]